jgi:hypothetical protein
MVPPPCEPGKQLRFIWYIGFPAFGLLNYDSVGWGFWPITLSGSLFSGAERADETG